MEGHLPPAQCTELLDDLGNKMLMNPMGDHAIVSKSLKISGLSGNGKLTGQAERV